jgi:AmiR/NasT family two-component response regulator
MKTSLRVAVADDESDMREYFEKVLPRIGHEVISVAQTGRELVEHCRANRPDLVITDIIMPDLNGLEAAGRIYVESPVPVVLVSGHSDLKFIEQAEHDYIVAYLVKPVKQGNLETAIALGVQRFAQFQTLRKEAADLRQALQERKLIERAKGVLMRRTNLDEQGAFRRLQKLASEKNQRLVEIAHIILTAEEAFSPRCDAWPG